MLEPLLQGRRHHYEGLSRLKRDAWVVHLDAQIRLPPQTRLLLQNANLDPGMIYVGSTASV